MILWGPPGTGKTTLARLMAEVAGARFVPFSAVLSGVKEIRQVMAEAEAERARRRAPHHPLRRRDPPLQQGRSRTRSCPTSRRAPSCSIGATTENPSFEVNARAPLALPRLRAPAARRRRPREHPRARRSRDRRARAGRHPAPPWSRMRSGLIARLSDGDARSALNILELAVTLHAGRPRDRGRRSARRCRRRRCSTTSRARSTTT